MEGSMTDTRDDLLDIFEAISKAQLRALRRLRLSPKTKIKARPTPEGRRISGMSMIEDILRQEGGPLHISDILTAVHKRFGVELDRESVVSAISKRVARRDRFLRIAPNTFALIREREDS
jgi:hypothetical protein